MRAVIYQHEEHEGLSLLEPLLVAAGFSLVKRFRGVAYHEDVSAPLLVVLGGDMSVSDDLQHPFLRDERAVLVERLSANKPCLGICLGGQLLASAAGSTVSRGKNGVERGVVPLRLTAAAASDAVMKGLPTKTLVGQWHQDTWAPLEGATLLASTERYTQQAIRFGDSYAFQFHPELSPRDWSNWVDVHAQSLKAEGVELESLRAQGSKLQSPAVTAFNERLVHHFAQRARA